jgi:hypothetical protein
MRSRLLTAGHGDTRRDMDDEKRARIERYTARVEEAYPDGIPRRLQQRFEIGARMIELDEPKLFTTIEYSTSNSNSWKEVFGACRATVYNAKAFSTRYDPLDSSATIR